MDGVVNNGKITDKRKQSRGKFESAPSIKSVIVRKGNRKKIMYTITFFNMNNSIKALMPK